MMIAALVAIALLIAVAILALCVVALVKPFSVGPVRIFSSRKAALITIPVTVVGFFVVVVALAGIDTGGDVFKPSAETLAAASASSAAESERARVADATAKDQALQKKLLAVRNVAQVTQVGDVLNITPAPIEAVFSEKDILEQASYIIKASGEAFKKNVRADSPVKNVVFKFQVAVHDKLGNQSNADLLELRYPASTLLAANYDHVIAEDLLDLAPDVSFANHGLIASSTWCMSKETVTPAFCQKLLNAAR